MARSVSQAVVIGGGNEGKHARAIFRGRLTENQQQVELRVGVRRHRIYRRSNWEVKPSSVSGLRFGSPGGAQLPEGGIWYWAAQWNNTFVYEKTRITDYRYCKRTQYRRSVDADPLYSTVSWRLDIFNPWSTGISGKYFLIFGLHRSSFEAASCFFSGSRPGCDAHSSLLYDRCVTVTFYNSENRKLLLPQRQGHLAEPGRSSRIWRRRAWDQHGKRPLQRQLYGGCTYGRSCAQLMQWCVAENNYSRISGRAIQTFLSRGAREQTQEEYPSRRWGYGQLDMRRTFDEIAGNYPE